MVEFKLTINDVKDGKSYSKEVKEAEADAFKGGKIGNKVKGDSFGFEGYEFEITGGSDNAGFPMRKDLNGQERKKILALNGEGITTKRKGARIRKSVRGNTLSHVISQINLKVVNYGGKSIKDILGIKEEAAPAEGEAKAEEAPKEAAEEKPKEEPVKEEKPEEKPAKDGKEENKESKQEEASPKE